MFASRTLSDLFYHTDEFLVAIQVIGDFRCLTSIYSSIVHTHIVSWVHITERNNVLPQYLLQFFSASFTQISQARNYTSPQSPRYCMPVVDVSGPVGIRITAEMSVAVKSNPWDDFASTYQTILTPVLHCFIFNRSECLLNITKTCTMSGRMTMLTYSNLTISEMYRYADVYNTLSFSPRWILEEALMNT